MRKLYKTCHIEGVFRLTRKIAGTSFFNYVQGVQIEPNFDF